MELNNIDVENETISDMGTTATNAEQLKEIINNIPDEDLEKLSKIDLKSMDPETIDLVKGGLSSKTLKYATITAALTTAAGLAGTAGYFAGNKLTKVDEDEELRNSLKQIENQGIIDGYAAANMVAASNNTEAIDRLHKLYNSEDGKRKRYAENAKDYLKKQANHK